MKELTASVAVVISLVGYIPYLLGIKKGTNKPHAYSWLVWTLVTWIIFATQVASGAGWGSAIYVVTGLICTVILYFSFTVGEKNRTPADLVMLCLALVSIPIWLLSKSPNASIVLVTLIDLFAFGPTIRKCWNKPNEEALISHTIAGVKYAVSILALAQYNFGTVFYPTVLVCVNLTFTLFVLWRRRVIG